MDIIIFWSCIGFFLTACTFLFFSKKYTIDHGFFILWVIFMATLYWVSRDFDRVVSRNILVTLFSQTIAFYIFLLYPKITQIIKEHPWFLKIGGLIDKYGIIFFAVFFFSVFCFITISRHIHFQTTGFDLGLFDQAAYQYSQGIFPAGSSIRNVVNIEGDHFNPILILYSWAYFIYSSPVTLLVIQNILFILGGLWLYKIVTYQLHNKYIAIGIFVLSCIFIWNVNALLFDFHPLTPAVSLLPWLVYFAMRNRWKFYFILLVPILLSKENMSLYVVFLGVYIFLALHNKKMWIITFLTGIWYFWLSMNYLLPLMGSEAWAAGRYWSYDSLGSNPRELIWNVITNPLDALGILFSHHEKIQTYLHHLWSGGYIGFLSPAIILLIPAYAQKFLSSRPEFWTLDFHYSIDIFWVIAIGIVLVFTFIKYRMKWNSSRIIAALFVGIFVNSLIINLHSSPLLHHVKKWENESTLSEIIETLPKPISISTQNQIVPHFSHNQYVYVFPQIENAEYILINTKIDELWPIENANKFEQYVEILQEGKKLPPIKLPFKKTPTIQEYTYDLILEKNGIMLFKAAWKQTQ